MVVILIALVGAIALAFVGMIIGQLRAGRPGFPRPEALGVGAITNFFDTLGIGSFAPTLAWLRLRRLTGDRAIPPTMYIGRGLPSIAQSIIFLILLGAQVDPTLLAGCVLALLAGAIAGVHLVGRVPLRAVRFGIGGALLIAACAYIATNLGMMPDPGTARSLPPNLFVMALAAYFVMGILINFGVGHYAPSLVIFSLMGIDTRLAFPIMATAGVVGVSGAAFKQIQNPAVDLRLVTGLAIGGIPAVLVAAFLVREMPLETLRWLVVAVVLYAAATLIWAALKEPPEVKGEPVTA